MCKLSLRFLLLLPLLFAGCSSTKKPAEAPPLLQVDCITARLDTLPRRMEFIGVLSSNFSTVIQPRVNGFLRAKHYDDGMPVKRGDLLFTIDEQQLHNTRLAAEAALESARVQLIEARNNYERARPLAQIEAISQTQLDQYMAQYAAAQSSLKSAEQTLHNAKLNESYTRIYAPIDGIAASSSAHAGDYVGPGTQFTALTTLSNMDTLSVDLHIPMSDYLALGGSSTLLYDNRDFLSDVRLYLADGSPYSLHGSYAYTRKDVSSGEGTLVLVVNFPNPKRTLKAGQFARVRARVGRQQANVVVPQQCVMQQQGLEALWVVGADSTVEFRRVTTGEIHDSLWTIRTGLQPGERVLVNGLQKVHEKQRVNFTLID